MKMRAVVIHKPGLVKIEKVNVPRPRRNDVVVETRTSSISAGTELDIFRGKVPLPLIRRGSPTPYTFPLVPGYESAGRVFQKGRGVADFDIEDRVFIGGTQGPYDGYCSMWGGDVEYAVVPSASLRKLPRNVSFETASAGLELAGLAVNAVHRARIEIGDVVTILGQGAVGQLVAQVSKLAGAGTVIVSDLFPARLEISKELAADFTINARREKVVERILELTDGKGSDVVFETAGVPETILEAPRVARDLGRIVTVGYHPGTISFQYEDLFSRNLDLRVVGLTSVDWRGDLPHPWVHWSFSWQRNTALKLISEGRVRIDRLITNRMPIEDIQRAYEILEKNPDKALKVTLLWKT